MVTDSRWAPTRKGMTVLGKVPKPINLPSQRLENHGLDPNVEIVPKGTLTWGSRSSPTALNAWGLSNHSSADAAGSVDSPTHFNCRPSSSGGGTRPSTAGSDRSSEHVASAWKSDSRPSSASGLLVSNQTQLAAQPPSADTRPGSSQLSRFADSANGHSGPWGSAGTAQKMHPASPGTRDFSLSSRDFPTLGSEKNSESHYEPDGHTSNFHAPTTASIEKNRLEISQRETEKIDVDSNKGSVNSWKTETPSNTSASMDSWHGNYSMQPTTNINPSQSLSNRWHGHPRSQNLSDGVWVGEVPCGGPYRPTSTAPSGNCRPDPFTCYPSQIPVRLDPNSRCSARPGCHQTGYQNENGEGFHPHTPEPFMVPTMPIIPVRPGVYHGPVSYDGRYVSAGFGGPNVRERSVVGFAPGPPVYGQFPNQTFHQGPVHRPLRPSGQTQLFDDKIENTCQREFATGQYKVLLKHHNHPVGTNSGGSRDQTGTSMTLQLRKNSTVEAVCGQGLQQKVIKDELKTSVSGEILHSNGLQGCSSEAIPANLSEKPSEKAGDKMIKKGDSSTASAEANHLTTKNSKLIEKIDTLNNKARVTEGRLEGSLTKDDNPAKGSLRNSVLSGSSFGGSSGAELPILNSNPHSESAVSSRIDLMECRSVKTLPVPSETHASIFRVSGSSDGNTKAHVECRKIWNMHGKGDLLSKSRMDCQENNHRTKQLPRKDSLVGSNSNSIHGGPPTEEFSSAQVHSVRLGSLDMDKPRDETYVPSPLDSVDYKSQRAKMKELAMQRARQLQQEEEERNREQKAKALAKLEELNRRTLCETSNKIANQTTSFHHNLQSMTGESADSAQSDAMVDRSVGYSSCSSSEIRTENNARGDTFHGVVVKTSGNAAKRHVGPTPPITSEPDNSYSDRATMEHKNDTEMSTVEDPNPLLAGQLPDMGSSKWNAYDNRENNGTKIQYLDSPDDCQYPGGLAASTDQIVSSKNVPADSFRKNKTQYHDNGSLKKRQTGHRRKQNIPEERTPEDKAVAPVEVASSEILMVAATETALGGRSPSIQSKEACTSSTQQRKNERNSKNKSKSGEAFESSTLTSAVQAKGILDKPADIHQHNQENLEDESVLPVSKTEKAGLSHNVRETTGSCSQGVLEAARGSVKATNHWKSNPSRRPSRNDNVVWAPVRPSKGELAEEESQTTQCLAHVIGNFSTGSTGIDNSGNVKSRRAEMQRYVPKVVAKDAPQVGNMQIPDCQTTVETVVTDDILVSQSMEHGLTTSEILAVTKNAEHIRPNRHGKSYGASSSWRQCTSQDGSVETASAAMSLPDQKQLEDASSSSHASRSNDILVTPNDASKEPMGVSDLKEHENTSRSRRQIPKVHKVVPSDATDFTSEITGKFEVQPLALDWNAARVKSTVTESLNPVERAKSQWKPKSRNISSHSNRQDTGSGVEKFALQTMTQDKGSPSIADQQARAPGKNIAGKTADMVERRHQPRREKKEIALENPNDQYYHGQRALSLEGPQHGMGHMKGKQTRYGGRFNKGQDNSYGDTGRQSFPNSGDRQRQTSHYEYQRTEARDSSDPFQSVGSSTINVPSGSSGMGPKFREKAQGHKKGGADFYVRSSTLYNDDKTSDRQS